jgi:hypothetical protein
MSFDNFSKGKKMKSIFIILSLVNLLCLVGCTHDMKRVPITDIPTHENDICASPDRIFETVTTINLTNSSFNYSCAKILWIIQNDMMVEKDTRWLNVTCVAHCCSDHITDTTDYYSKYELSAIYLNRCIP